MTAQVKAFVVYQFENETIAQNVLASLTEEKLSDKVFEECGEWDSLKVGFTTFTNENFILESGSDTVVQVTSQQKKPKASEVKRRCKKAEQALMEDTGLEELSKDQKEDIKALITQEMLPETPADEEVTNLVWFTGDKLIVGVGTYKKAEEIISFLRTTIDSVPVTPLEVESDVSAKLTKLVEKKDDDIISLGEKVEMITEDGVKIVFSKGSVYDAETDKHIKDGAVVTKLMCEVDGVTFVIDTELQFTAVKIDRDILCGAKDEAANIVTMAEVDRVVKEVIEFFGG